MNERIGATIMGNHLAPELRGIVRFYPFLDGSLVEIEVINMPTDQSHPYALHIHEGSNCGDDSFEAAGNHYNTKNQLHPEHEGDLPPLFSNNGYSYMTVYTNRFTPNEVIGRTIIIHNGNDDFKSQPAGNSGARIACGMIQQQ